MRYPIRILAGIAMLLTAGIARPADALTLHAAGSLKAALGEVAAAYTRATGVAVETHFGPSGLLRKAIEDGERPDVFASANMAHPERLAQEGWGRPVVLFARNQLCALAQPDVDVDADRLLAVIVKPDVRLGTSTPKADPSGDYAWKLFENAEKIRPGSFSVLSSKALKLTGGPDSEKPPQGRNTYGWLMEERRADLFLTYCTNAVLARREVPGLQIVDVPDALAVGADYGLLVRNEAPEPAWRLAMFILSPEGQRILRAYGFAAPGVPR
ncbi:MAG: molybdate ABC transporter substrate-binding protein [Rhodocyclaceae bacterium]|nr:molybdate ABC transporter substrate-binding protein [Rhodocyclaceae bacterium]